MILFRSSPQRRNLYFPPRDCGAAAVLMLIAIHSAAAQELKIGGGGPVHGPHPLAAALLRDVGNDKSLIVWMVDADLDDKHRREGIPIVIEPVLAELEAKFAAKGDQLFHSVVAVGTTTRFLTENPTNDWTKIRRAFKAIKSDGSGMDIVFTGARETAMKYRRYQTSGLRKLVIVLVSDEIGDDEKEADEAAALFVRNRVTFHAIAPTAAFGRRYIHDRWVDPVTKFKFYLPLKRGPFTRRLEFVALSRDDTLLSAGFGPFHLAMLTNRSGGVFVPFGDGRLHTPPYAPTVLSRYLPDYSDAKSYAEIELTPRRLELVKIAEEIAKTAHVSFFRRWIRDVTRSEEMERFAKECDETLAAVETGLSLLQPAEKEWAAETAPRWRANYDLSMGRLLLAKASIEEMQHALAEFRAKSPVLADAKNNGWSIDWVPELRIGAHRSLLDKSREHFERVQREHPETPWHYAAQQEQPTLAGVRLKEGSNPDYVRPEDRKARSQVKAPKL